MPSNNNEPEKPVITKTDQAIVNYLWKKLPEKEAMFSSVRRVNYFIGSKAIDELMNSKWAKGDDALFKKREEARLFMDDLLMKQEFFHRAKKLIKIEGEKKRFKLDMHNEQVFLDSKEPYVWIFEATSIKAWLIGLGVVVAVIAVCLFPLWPPIIRTWVYYLCIAGLIFLSSILGLIVLSHFVYYTLRLLTFGKLHFWLLPNLTEDVGFFESFWPLYAIGAIEGSEGATESGGGGGDDGGSAHPKSE